MADADTALQTAPTLPGEPSPSPDDAPPSRWRRIAKRMGLGRYSAVYLWALFLVVFGLLNPGAYLSDTTFRLVFSEGVAPCLVALAFLIPLTAGVFDVSVGALFSLSLAITVYLEIHTGLSPVIGGLIGIAACAAAGALSAFLVVRLHVHSFIATLGVSQVLLAAVLLISQNRQLVAEFPAFWSDLGNSEILGIPIVAFYLVAVAAILWYVLEHTPVGRRMFAVGGNTEASRLSGVRTNSYILGTLVASGVVAGLAGVVYSMRIGVYSTSLGPGLLFPAIAAVFLGASQLSQRPNVWGTLIAYFALAFGVQGISLSASSAAVWSRPLFEGIALIIAVAVASRPAVARLRGGRGGIEAIGSSN